MSFESELDKIKKNLNDLYGKVGLNPRTIPPTLKRKEMLHNLYKGKMEPHYYDDREPKENALDKMADRFWERYKDSAEAKAIEYQRAVELERIIRIIEQEKEDAIIETLNQYFTDSGTTMNYFSQLLMKRYFGGGVNKSKSIGLISIGKPKHFAIDPGYYHPVSNFQEEIEEQIKQARVNRIINNVESNLEYNKEMLSQINSPLNNNHEVTNELNGLVIGDESSDFTDTEQEVIKELKPESKAEIHSFNTRSQIDVNKLREERTKALNKFSTVDLQEELNRRMKERQYRYD